MGNEKILSIDEARSRVWGHLMMKGEYIRALSFAYSIGLLAEELKDEDLIQASRSMIAKSAEEIYSKNTNLPDKDGPPKCSFCNKSPPLVSLRSGLDAFICNECTYRFEREFDAAKLLR